MCASITNDPLRVSCSRLWPLRPYSRTGRSREALATPLRGASALSLIFSVGREFRLGSCQDAHVQ